MKYVVVSEDDRVFGTFNNKEDAGMYVYNNYIEPFFDREMLEEFAREEKIHDASKLWEHVDGGATVVELEGVE